MEGGFLGTLASIGIRMAISLVSRMFGGGLQIHKAPLTNVSNVYMPQQGRGHGYPYYPPPVVGENWNKDTIGMGRKKKPQRKGKGLLLGKNSPFNSILILGQIL